MDSSVSPTSGVTPAEPESVDKLIGQYVAVRDRKRVMASQHREQMKPFDEVLEALEGKLLAHLDAAKVNSITGASGNVHRITKKSATIKDGVAFRMFVINNGEFDLVDWRANANACFDYIESHEGTTPPGVNASTYTTIGVRRPGDNEE